MVSGRLSPSLCSVASSGYVPAIALVRGGTESGNQQTDRMVVVQGPHGDARNSRNFAQPVRAFVIHRYQRGALRRVRVKFELESIRPVSKKRAASL